MRAEKKLSRREVERRRAEEREWNQYLHKVDSRHNGDDESLSYAIVIALGLACVFVVAGLYVLS